MALSSKALIPWLVSLVLLFCLIARDLSVANSAWSPQYALADIALSVLPSFDQRSWRENFVYNGSSLEDYVMKNLRHLGYETKPMNYSKGCTIWTSETENAKRLRQFRANLARYHMKLRSFHSPYKDIREVLDKANVCKSLEVSSGQTLINLFQGELSESRSGFIEPILPPLRSPSFCFNRMTGILSLDYLIHDFVEICEQLKPSSRIVFFDLGASLHFHGKKIDSPALYIPELFSKFGMPFDHIYAFELTPTDPSELYDKVPDDLKTVYHWYNVGVSAETNSTRNPWNLIRGRFKEDDLVIVKLDIDTPSVELPLADQLLKDPELHRLVDHFYFEHHVYLEELKESWGPNISGSVADSLRLFHGLRKAGIAAHSWV